MKTPRKLLSLSLSLSLLISGALTLGISGCSQGNASMTGSGTVGSLGNYQISTWGDSLTEGDEDGSGVEYPIVLAKMTGQTVLNLGIAAQTSSEIAARMNGYAGQPQQTFPQGFTIPTSGTVDVSFQTGFQPINKQAHGLYQQGVKLSLTVGGETYTGNVTTSDDMTYVFAPDSYPTAPVTVPQGTAWTVVEPQGAESGCVIVWAGRDNVDQGVQVETDIAAIVAAVRKSTSCYLVLGITNSANPLEAKGNKGYNVILAIDNALSAAYSPGNHYLDIRSALVSLYDPNNPADVLDHDNDVIPYSLRAQDQPGTLTAPVTSPTSCDFTTTAAAAKQWLNGRVITIDSEMIQILGGSNGAWQCNRGYAGTSPETYASGSAYTGVDTVHPGQNLQSPKNPFYSNGYDAVAAQVYAWLKANGPK